MKILFTHLKPDIWQYKVASTLRKKGVKTSSISLLAFNRKMFHKAFDEIICLNLPNLKPFSIVKTIIQHPANLFKFFYKLATIKADAGIIQGPPLYLTSFFLRLFKGRFPRIFFSYDVLSAIYENIREHLSKIELWGEKYSFINCDAILEKNSAEELKLLPKSFEADKKPVIEFCGYPLEEWFVEEKPARTKEIHIAYAGFVMDTPLLKFISDIREVLKQQIYVHLYPNNRVNKKDIDRITKNTDELKKYLYIHYNVDSEELNKDMAKYDFGFLFADYFKGSKKDAVKYALGNKRAAYFESLLPAIAKNNNLFICEPIKKYYLGICLDDIKKLRKEVEKFNYKKSIKNIRKYRAENSVYTNIGRLIKFVKDLKNAKL